VAAVGVDDGRERAPVVDALALGAVKDPLEGTRVERGGDVEDRPRRARDANGVGRRDVGRCEVAGAMDAQARLPARPGARQGDVDQHRVGSPQAPERRR
jgi:hypothetical protein